jgi:chromosome segregation ATPase
MTSALAEAESFLDRRTWAPSDLDDPVQLLADLKQETAELEDEQASLHQKLDDMETDLDEATDEIKKLKRRLEKAQFMIDAVNDALSDYKSNPQAAVDQIAMVTR